MPDKPLDRKELGTYFSLAQVGMEMVLPVVAGLLLDNYLSWGPWGVVGGAGLGLTMGLVHLVAMTNRAEDGKGSKPKQGPR